MALRQSRPFLVVGLVAAILAAVWGSRFCPRGKQPGGDDDRGTTLYRHRFPVQDLAFSTDGATLTSAACYASSSEVEVKGWDVAKGRPTLGHTVPLSEIHWVALAPGAKMLAVVGMSRGTWLWDTAGIQERCRLGEPQSLVRALAFSSDGAQLATADFAGLVTLWDVASGRPRSCYKGGTVLALALTPDGRTLAGGEAEGNAIRLWDAATGELRGTFSGPASAVMALTFSPDGRILASGDIRGGVKLWDVAKGKERATLTASENQGVKDAAALAFAPDGRTLAVAVDQAVRLWDVATGRLVVRLVGHEGRVKCLAYSPDGKLLASGGYDKTVRLWGVTRGD